MLKNKIKTITNPRYGSDASSDNESANYNILEKGLEETYYLYRISKCITIPNKDNNNKLLVEVEGVDLNTGIVNFNQFGHTKSDLISSRHVELLDAVIDRDVIIFDRFLLMLDPDEKNFDEINYSIDNETIQKICTAVLNRYLCQKFVCRDYKEHRLLGGMSLEY